MKWAWSQLVLNRKWAWSAAGSRPIKIYVVELFFTTGATCHHTGRNTKIRPPYI